MRISTDNVSVPISDRHMHHACAWGRESLGACGEVGKAGDWPFPVCRSQKGW